MSAQSDKSHSSSLPSSPLGWSGSDSERNFAGTAIGPRADRNETNRGEAKSEQGEVSQNEVEHAPAAQTAIGGVEVTIHSETLL